MGELVNMGDQEEAVDRMTLSQYFQSAHKPIDASSKVILCQYINLYACNYF